MPPTSICCNTPIDYNIVICYNCGKDKYFTLFYLKLKNISDIKKIKKEEIFDKLGKEEL